MTFPFPITNLLGQRADEKGIWKEGAQRAAK